MKDSKKAVFIDIDGTLYSGEKDVLIYNIEVIQKVREKGHKVFINTGRAISNMPDEINLKKDFDGAVMANGSHLMIDGKTVFLEFMNKDLIVSIYEKLRDAELPFLFEGDKNILHFCEEKNIFSDNIIRIETVGELKKELEKANYNKAVYEGVLPDKKQIENISEELKVIQLKNYGEIVTKNTDKAFGMKKLSELVGICRENTIAIGDSMNDFGAFQYAGISIAMGNAEETIKNMADIVCENCSDYGVSKALERIFLKN